MASPGGIREKLRRKRRDLQESLAMNKDEDDIKELQSSEEDPGETLKRTFRAQREKKKRLLEQSSAQELHHDDGVQEISSIQPHSEEEESAEQAAQKPAASSRPPTGSLKGHSSKIQHSPGSQHVVDSVTRRLEERLKAARSKGERLQEQEATQEQPSHLQGLRDRDTVTRFDPEVDPERVGRHDVPPSLSSRVKFREAARRTEKGIPTAEEAYNFFTFNFEPEPQKRTKKVSRKRPKPNRSEEEEDGDGYGEGEEAEEEDVEGEEENRDEIEDQGEEAPLVQDEGQDLFVIEQSSYDFLEMKKAEYVGYKKLVQRENELLFTPSLRTVPTSVKLPQNMKPRYLEDEGLYVGERPPVSPTNENILENRILAMEEGREWFGDDGRIMALPDIKARSNNGEDDPALQTV
ncbi:coiled-coil and C2 domain-containing protein 2A isoform X4 [Xyrichtys novacula]|uniref:Coiled-coil and C2 domain-containing protein 2A isoform X4 n=1 Tax=Xyrichtys novacula TaxID=13765 RepID=A0AAV1FGP6_XYRNO|nr:coiled-coil and C2 domain-containing protein 2A isoform X4 [Xyrichtys novacula]